MQKTFEQQRLCLIMNNYIVNIILIAALAVAETNTQSCEESRQLDSNCGGYCFKAVKPMLDYTKKLKLQVEEHEIQDKSETFNKIETLERLMISKFDKLEKQMEQSKPVQKDIIKNNDKISFQRLGTKYYFIEHNEKLNWFEAANKCRTYGGNLANVESREELNALVPKLYQYTYWLDINDLGKENEFRSLTTGERAKYLVWNPNEPNNYYNEDCVLLVHKTNYAMNDDPCNYNHNYICEKSVNECEQ